MCILHFQDVSSGLDKVHFLDEAHGRKCNTVCELTQGDVNDLLETPSQLHTTGKAKYSILDLMGLKFSHIEALVTFIQQNFKIDANSPEGMLQLNRVYDEVCKIYQTRYLRVLPDSLKPNNGKPYFRDIKAIFSYLSGTGLGNIGIMKCELAKLFFAVGTSLHDLKITGLHENHSDIITQIRKGVQIDTIDGQPDVLEGVYTFQRGGERQTGHTALFTLFGRPKSHASVVGKEVGNASYCSLDDFKDLHGITFEIQEGDKQGLIYLLQNYYQRGLFIEGEVEIENKELLSEDDVTATQNLDGEFKHILLAAIAKSKRKTEEKRERKGSSHRYEDIKLKGKIKVKNPLGEHKADIITGLEIKFTLEGNQNEYGLAFHPIVDYKKRFRELTRLSGRIRRKDILNFVNEFFETLDENLNYKRKDRSEYLEELFLDLKEKGCLPREMVLDPLDSQFEKKLAIGLFKHFESELIPVKRSKKTKNVFYVHPDYEVLAEAGIMSPLYHVQLPPGNY